MCSIIFMQATGVCKYWASIFEYYFTNAVSTIKKNTSEGADNYFSLLFSSGHMCYFLMLKCLLSFFQGRKLLVIGTTGAAEVLNEMGMIDVFNKSFHVPELKAPEIKKVSFWPANAIIFFLHFLCLRCGTAKKTDDRNSSVVFLSLCWKMGVLLIYSTLVCRDENLFFIYM